MELSTSMTDNEVIQKAEEFNNKFSNPRSTIDIEYQEQKRLWSTLLELIGDTNKKKCHGALLNACKILTRNRELMAQCVKKETLELLLLRGGITAIDEFETISSEQKSTSVRENIKNRDIRAIDESLRCLSNIYLQCAKSDAALSLEKDIISGIMHQSKRYRELKIPLSVISFDMRLLFLVTAYFPESRTLLHIEHDGIIQLANVLSHCLDMAKNDSEEDEKASVEHLEKSSLLSTNEKDCKIVLNEEHVTAMTNTLKVLFNCTCAASPEENSEDEELMSNLSQLSRTLHLLLTVEKEKCELRTAITRDTINLLTNFPPGKCALPLLSALNEKMIASSKSKEIMYEGQCMNAPREILYYLIDTVEKFQSGSPDVTSLREGIVPVLKVLCNLAIGHRFVRKYYKEIVLPPLKDLNQRPEVGNSIRSRLCRLLTSPESQVSNMVAEFLFILCKEDVKRLVKHTGYGNAAGLLARRGLMAGGRGSGAAQYSDDEDSDTEEFKEKAHMVNPVSGCVEPERPSPFAGMSEEQKEYEANKLANIIDRLHSLGVVKPGKLGPDGKPTAVDHVLELVENHAANIKGLQPESGSDSDD